MIAAEEKLRAAIVAEALSWEGTKYLPHAAIKGFGVDCAMFPAAVFGPKGLGITGEVNADYSSQWMNHRDEELYLAEIRKWAREISEDELAPGDLVVWKFGRTYSHSAIVIDPPLVIHAAIKGGVHRMNMDQDEDYRPGSRHPRKAFSVFAPDGKLRRGLGRR